MEFTALVVTFNHEQEDGLVTIDPLALATTSRGHINQESGYPSGSVWLTKLMNNW